VPFSHIEPGLDKHVLSGAGQTLADFHESFYLKLHAPKDKDKLLNSVTRITDQIEKLQTLNHTSTLYKERTYPEPLRCLLKAVYAAPPALTPDTDTPLATGEYIKSGEILTAIEWYRSLDPTDGDDGNSADDADAETPSVTVRGYEQETLARFDTAQSIALYLSKFDNDDDNSEDNHPDVETVSGKYNRYKLTYRNNNYTQVDIAKIGDLLAFPCMQNLHEFLKETNKPVRWMLYTFVRYLDCLDIDFGVEDIKEWFNEHYAWYDPAITEFQANYEMNERDNDHIRPISCNHSNKRWAEFCIGREDCEHSLYGSVEFTDRVDELIDGDGPRYNRK